MRTAISIVLNGMHHLREQAKIIPKIFDKWIIVEGATKNVKCSNWCQDMPEDFHDENGNSIDGTKEYLQELADKFENVDVYLASGLWEGKVSMFNHADCASFVCDYLLSEDIIVRGMWGEGQAEGYKRCWKYDSGRKFKTHIPPHLEGESKCLHWGVTPRFTHLSYYFEDQVKFKSKFYTNHENIYSGWKKIVDGSTLLPCGVDKLFEKPVSPHWQNTIITYR